MKYVQLNGGIWQITDREYRQLLQAIAFGWEINLNRYGKLITTELVNYEDLVKELINE